MTNKTPKNHYIFLGAITIIALGLVWYYSQVTVNEISILTSNISGVVIENKDEPKDESKSESSEPSEPEKFVCQSPILKVDSVGLYYSSQGDQLGVGPLPPMVNVQTSYWVFWEISNLNKNLKDFEVTAQLPDGIVWNNKKTALAGSLQYGEMTRKVVWTVDQVEQGKGNYKVGFEVGLIPTDQDTGKILNLLTDIKYQAIDKSCNEKVSGSLNNITTDLVFDNLAKGKGIIIPFE